MDNQNSHSNKKFVLRLIICAIIFVSIFVISHISTVSNIFSAVFSVLLPIIIGAGLAYMLNPILKLYENKVLKKIKHKGVLRGISILLTYLTLVLILSAFAVILIPSLITSIENLLGNSAAHYQTIADLINNIIFVFTKDPAHKALITGENLKLILGKIINVFFQSSGDTMNIISGVGTGIKNAFLIFFISLYILISKEHLAARFRKLSTAAFGARGRRRLYRYILVIHRNFGGYFAGVLLDAFIVMIVSFISFIIFNIPYAPLIAMIIGATNIIPIFGPFIGAIPSFIIIFIENPTKAVIFAILILVIQQIDGNIIAPKVLGDSTNISSLGVIIAITVMGSYFGIIGMIIGVPVFATLIAIGKEFINDKLRKANLSTDTADYYSTDSLVDPHEVHESFSHKLFRRAGEFFRKLFRIKKKETSAESQKSEESTEAQEDIKQ